MHGTQGCTFFQCFQCHYIIDSCMLHVECLVGGGCYCLLLLGRPSCTKAQRHAYDMLCHRIIWWFWAEFSNLNGEDGKCRTSRFSTNLLLFIISYHTVADFAVATMACVHVCAYKFRSTSFYPPCALDLLLWQIVFVCNVHVSFYLC